MSTSFRWIQPVGMVVVHLSERHFAIHPSRVQQWKHGPSWNPSIFVIHWRKWVHGIYVCCFGRLWPSLWRTCGNLALRPVHSTTFQCAGPFLGKCQATVRVRRGIDIDAGCGQLAAAALGWQWFSDVPRKHGGSFYPQEILRNGPCKSTMSRHLRLRNIRNCAFLLKKMINKQLWL